MILLIEMGKVNWEPSGRDSPFWMPLRTVWFMGWNKTSIFKKFGRSWFQPLEAFKTSLEALYFLGLESVMESWKNSRQRICMKWLRDRRICLSLTKAINDVIPVLASYHRNPDFSMGLCKCGMHVYESVYMHVCVWMRKNRTSKKGTVRVSTFWNLWDCQTNSFLF